MEAASTSTSRAAPSAQEVLGVARGMPSGQWPAAPERNRQCGRLTRAEEALLARLLAARAILPVIPARTWLLAVGWRRHGRIRVGEIPEGRA